MHSVFLVKHLFAQVLLFEFELTNFPSFHYSLILVSWYGPLTESWSVTQTHLFINKRNIGFEKYQGDCVYLQKAASMNPEQREPSFSPPSALALSNMEEGVGHNIERAQALQEDLSQRRASLQHHSAEAQALQGQEALLADIIEEEMAHWTQVSVLSQLHLQQAKEIKSQSKEIRQLSTLLEKQQAILERVQEQQSRVPEIPVPLVDRIQELWRGGI